MAKILTLMSRMRTFLTLVFGEDKLTRTHRSKVTSSAQADSAMRILAPAALLMYFRKTLGFLRCVN